MTNPNRFVVLSCNPDQQETYVDWVEVWPPFPDPDPLQCESGAQLKAIFTIVDIRCNGSETVVCQALNSDMLRHMADLLDAATPEQIKRDIEELKEDYGQS